MLKPRNKAYTKRCLQLHKLRNNFNNTQREFLNIFKVIPENYYSCILQKKPNINMTKNILSSPLKRITILDSLRGFALLGVIIIHMLQHFGVEAGAPKEEILQFPLLDEVMRWIGYNIVMGRFINIFALLFGLSFFIQMDRASKKGIDFRGRFAWRMIILLIMGVVSHSFYNVEIISVYALFGLLMIPLYKTKSWILLVLASFFLLGGPRIIQSTYHNHNIKTEHVNSEEANNFERSIEIPAHIANPSFLNSAKHNYKERFLGKLRYQFSYFGRGYITFALFLFGLLLGKIRFFENIDIDRKRNLKIFSRLLLATIILITLENILPPQNFRIFFRTEGVVILPILLFAKALADISLVVSSAALTMGFILLYQSKHIRKYLEALSPYGRTGLSNYIIQGMLGCILFSSWALGSYFNGLGNASLFFLGIIIYIVQAVISAYWLKYYLYGPLEWLWRSLTYLKFQNFRKNINN